MADTAMTFKGGGVPVAPADTGAGTEAPRSSAPAEIKSITDIMSLCTAPTILSKEGEAYIEKIVEALEQSGRPAKSHRIVGANYEARIIESGGKYQVFVFAETYTSTGDPTPIATCAKDFRVNFRSAGFDPAQVAQFIVVTKEDYEKVDIMAAYIVNSYLAADTKVVRELSAAQLATGTFRITTDPSAVSQYIEQTYPLKTLPRSDVKLLLYTVRQIENSYDSNGRPEVQRIPIVAVGAYTDFEYFSSVNFYTGNTQKFSPLTVITGTHSRLVSEKIAIVGTIMARWVFITQGRWLEQFSSFQKGSPDIGMLVLDEKGRPCQAANITDRNLAIERALSSRIPNMAIDLQYGAPIMPGLRDLIRNAAAFNQLVDNFTGGKGASQAANPYQLMAIRSDGRVRVTKNGVADYVDTRVVDYLHLLTAGVDPKSAADMLQPALDPKIKADALKRSYPEAQLLYVTHRLILNPVWVDGIMADIVPSLRVQIDGSFAPNTYDLSQLAAFQQSNIGFMGGAGNAYQVCFF